MEKKDNGYVLGTIGALLFGLIATLPWVLIYVYMNMMYSILAIFIGIAALRGYEMFKGKVDKKLPIIITVVSLISISIATLVIIPNLLLIKEVGTTSLEMFGTLYQNDEFKSAIMGDFIVSLLFTVLGISGVIGAIKRHIASGNIGKVDLKAPAYVPDTKDTDEIKRIFTERNAINKEYAIPEYELSRLKEEKGESFMYLIQRGIIRKTKRGYYYSSKDEENPNRRFLKIFICTLVVVFIFIILMIIIFTMDSNEVELEDSTATNEVYYDVLDGFEVIDGEEVNSFFVVPKDDEYRNSGYIVVAHYSDKTGMSFEEAKDELDDIYSNNEEYKESKDIVNTPYDTAGYYFETDEYFETMYYVHGIDKYAFIDCIFFEGSEDAKISEACDKLVKTFVWR